MAPFIFYFKVLSRGKRERDAEGVGGGLDYKAVAGECIFHACWAAWAGRVWRCMVVGGGCRGGLSCGGPVLCAGRGYRTNEALVPARRMRKDRIPKL